MKKTEKSLRILWDNIKYTSIHIIRVPEGEEREKGPEKIFKKIIAKNFPNMGKETLIQNWGSTENSIQDKPKEKHSETQTNQTDKN